MRHLAPLSWADQRILAAMRSLGRNPRISRAARAFSYTGEHAALWLAIGLAGAATNHRWRDDHPYLTHRHPAGRSPAGQQHRRRQPNRGRTDRWPGQPGASHADSGHLRAVPQHSPGCPTPPARTPGKPTRPAPHRLGGPSTHPRCEEASPAGTTPHRPPRARTRGRTKRPRPWCGRRVAPRARRWLKATTLVAAAHLASMAVKRLVRRPRPNQPAGLTPPMAIPQGPGFPSSHAASSVAAACAFRSLAAPAPLGAGAAAMCLSRLIMGVHYPSDIAAGAALGALTARIFRSWLGDGVRHGLPSAPRRPPDPGPAHLMDERPAAAPPADPDPASHGTPGRNTARRSSDTPTLGTPPLSEGTDHV